MFHKLKMQLTFCFISRTIRGTRQQLFVLPYRKVLHYGIQTAGFGDPLQASQLTVCFADGHEAKFGFIGQKDLFQVANAISARIL